MRKDSERSSCNDEFATPLVQRACSPNARTQFFRHTNQSAWRELGRDNSNYLGPVSQNGAAMLFGVSRRSGPSLRACSQQPQQAFNDPEGRREPRCMSFGPELALSAAFGPAPPAIPV